MPAKRISIRTLVRNLLAKRSALRDSRRVFSDERGIAAVEFALILPIMVVLWIGGVEVTGALSVDRRLNNLASSIGDLVARSKVVSDADIDAIFDIAPGAMYPYGTGGLSMRITEVEIDDDGNAKVYWSRAKGSETARAVGTAMNDFVPETLRVDNTHIVMAEVFTTYTPSVGYVVTGELDLEDRMFFVPRLAAKVKKCTTAEPPVCTT